MKGMFMDISQESVKYIGQNFMSFRSPATVYRAEFHELQESLQEVVPCTTASCRRECWRNVYNYNYSTYVCTGKYVDVHKYLLEQVSIVILHTILIMPRCQSNHHWKNGWAWQLERNRISNEDKLVLLKSSKRPRVILSPMMQGVCDCSLHVLWIQSTIKTIFKL